MVETPEAPAPVEPDPWATPAVTAEGTRLTIGGRDHVLGLPEDKYSPDQAEDIARHAEHEQKTLDAAKDFRTAYRIWATEDGTVEMNQAEAKFDKFLDRYLKAEDKKLADYVARAEDPNGRVNLHPHEAPLSLNEAKEAAFKQIDRVAPKNIEVMTNDQWKEFGKYYRNDVWKH